MRTIRLLQAAPFVLLGGTFGLLIPRATRAPMLWALQEDHPVEQLTFAFLLAGAAVALRLAWLARSERQRGWVTWYYTAFGLGLLLIAMEEVSWGQRIFGFETPPAMTALNAQNETNLHNIGPLQGRSEWMRLLFGLGGLVGLALGASPRWAPVSVPLVLWPWFALIAGHAAIDVLNDIWPIEPRFDFAMQRTSEMVELMVGIAAFLYAWLKLSPLRSPMVDRSKLAVS